MTSTHALLGLALYVCVVQIACSFPDVDRLGGDPAGAPDTAAAAADGGAPRPDGQPPAGDAAAQKICDPQSAAIQAAFDGGAPADINASVAIYDRPCGARFFTRGPARYAATTLHAFASNTKMYVASLILILADDELLSLDAPVSTWLANVPGGNAIHVRHLLNHTSGLFDYLKDVTFQAEAALQRQWTPLQLLDVSFNHKVDFAPGTGWSYSNTNYIALGVIAERVTSKPAELLIRERVLTRVGATSTFFNGKEPLNGVLAKGNSTIAFDPSAAWCAGALVGTLQDLAIFTGNRGSGRLHTTAADLALFQTVATNDAHARYGAGIIELDPSKTHGGGKALGHGGDIFGAHSYALYFPDHHTALALVVDDDRGPSGTFPATPSTYREPLFDAVTTALFAPAR